MSKTILVGAVAYAPQIVPIWDTIRDYANEFLKSKNMRLDYVLFSNYERQVDYTLSGKIDIAWNTNVAYVRVLNAHKNAQALLLRDTDIVFKSIFVAKKGANLNFENLGGKTLGLGSLDSAQATILPIYYLQKAGVKITEFDAQNFGWKDWPNDLTRFDGLKKIAKNAQNANIVRFNSDVGKHGDTGRSEFDVMDAIKAGAIDCGAVGSTTWARVLAEGSYPELESFYASEDFCHCNFTALESLDSEKRANFVEMMLSQNEHKNDPKIAQMMKLEGLNKWVVPDCEIMKGYESIITAMKEQGL